MLHDLKCENPEDMLTPEFAARMRQINHPKGKVMSSMWELVEEFCKEECESTARRGVKSLLKQGSPFHHVAETFSEDLPKEELLALQRDA